jgi:hypothetical protein
MTRTCARSGSVRRMVRQLNGRKCYWVGNSAATCSAQSSLQAFGSNTTWASFFDLCAISLLATRRWTAPRPSPVPHRCRGGAAVCSLTKEIARGGSGYDKNGPALNAIIVIMRRRRPMNRTRFAQSGFVGLSTASQHEARHHHFRLFMK